MKTLARWFLRAREIAFFVFLFVVLSLGLVGVALLFFSEDDK